MSEKREAFHMRIWKTLMELFNYTWIQFFNDNFTTRIEAKQNDGSDLRFVVTTPLVIEIITIYTIYTLFRLRLPVLIVICNSFNPMTCYIKTILFLDFTLIRRQKNDEWYCTEHIGFILPRREHESKRSGKGKRSKRL